MLCHPATIVLVMTGNIPWWASPWPGTLLTCIHHRFLRRICCPGQSAEMCRRIFVVYKFWRIFPGIFLFPAAVADRMHCLLRRNRPLSLLDAVGGLPLSVEVEEGVCLILAACDGGYWAIASASAPMSRMMRTISPADDDTSGT